MLGFFFSRSWLWIDWCFSMSSYSYFLEDYSHFKGCWYYSSFHDKYVFEMKDGIWNEFFKCELPKYKYFLDAIHGHMPFEVVNVNTMFGHVFNNEVLSYHN
jgi:hypothetical protein